MKTCLALIFFLASSTVFCQEFVTEINGFKLRQYREVPKNEIKTLMKQDKFEDGFEYEAYSMEPDQSVYMVFEYAKSNLETIWSIQLSGIKKGYDCKFKGLRLGMASREVDKILGKPSSIKKIGEYGEQWTYENTNYSIEITPDGVLSSVKITDDSPQFSTEVISKIPTFEQYSKILLSENKKLISELLAPDLEVYKSGSTLFFKRAMSNEIEHDHSGIFKLIDEVAAIIKETTAQNKVQYQENMRFTSGSDPLHVAKFTSNYKKLEIVFKYMFGRYLIWEIKFF